MDELLRAFAAATDPSGALSTNAATSSATADTLSAFPGEEPPVKEKHDWVRANQPIMRRKFGALLRGETPAELVAYLPSNLPDLTALVLLTDPDAVGGPAKLASSAAI